MKTSAQLTFGLMSGENKIAPYAVGDVLVHRTFGRIVVVDIDRDPEAKEPEVLVCAAQTDGRTCIALPREILYRSR
jgi:heat shock protein HspQ